MKKNGGFSQRQFLTQHQLIALFVNPEKLLTVRNRVISRISAQK